MHDGNDVARTVRRRFVPRAFMNTGQGEFRTMVEPFRL